MNYLVLLIYKTYAQGLMVVTSNKFYYLDTFSFKNFDLVHLWRILCYKLALN